MLSNCIKEEVMWALTQNCSYCYAKVFVLQLITYVYQLANMHVQLEQPCYSYIASYKSTRLLQLVLHQMTLPCKDGQNRNQDRLHCIVLVITHVDKMYRYSYASQQIPLKLFGCMINYSLLAHYKHHYVCIAVGETYTFSCSCIAGQLYSYIP